MAKLAQNRVAVVAAVVTVDKDHLSGSARYDALLLLVHITVHKLQIISEFL